MRRTSQKILVVEDDPKTSEIVRAYLEQSGYQVWASFDGPSGISQAQSLQPDLVVLDLMLPELGGIEVCQALRQESEVPIVMLTALSTLPDKLEGLDLGADDYVTKPFSPSELVARVRAVLRRCSDPQTTGSNVFSWGELSVDLEQCSVFLRGSEPRLTPTEFKLLAALLREPGRVFTRAQLVEKAMGPDYEGMDRTMDVHILNLRRKIEADPNNPEYIHTVYGIGYKLGN